MDINPLLADKSQITAVDARIKVKKHFLKLLAYELRNNLAEYIAVVVV